MDLPEMGALAYPEFEFAIEQSDPEIGTGRSSARAGASVPRERRAGRTTSV